MPPTLPPLPADAFDVHTFDCGCAVANRLDPATGERQFLFRPCSFECHIAELVRDAAVEHGPVAVKTPDEL